MEALYPPASSFSPDPHAVCVYCASSPGLSPEYRKAAESLGAALASSSRTLIYGAIVILNVNGFYEPLRTLIERAIRETFIPENGRRLATFVDPPANVASIDFDWGKAAMDAIESWSGPEGSSFTWDEKGKWGSI
ncbi:hypothetical protein FRB90_004424 [Tulasnella sp. 427]|nr:hypothetical protein FRB90_004424 [Tulasnella sp. 427]